MVYRPDKSMAATERWPLLEFWLYVIAFSRREGKVCYWIRERGQSVKVGQLASLFVTPGIKFV